MLRYQQGFDFFDVNKVSVAIQFAHIDDSVLRDGFFEGLLAFIIRKVEEVEPSACGIGFVLLCDREPGWRRPVWPGALCATPQPVLVQLAGDDVPVGDTNRQQPNPLFYGRGRHLVVVSDRGKKSRPCAQLQVDRDTGTGAITGDLPVVSHRQVCRCSPFIHCSPTTEAPDGAVLERCSGPGRMLHGKDLQPDISVLMAGRAGSGNTVLSMQFIAEGVRARANRHVIVVFKRTGPLTISSPFGPWPMYKDLTTGPMPQFVNLRPLRSFHRRRPCTKCVNRCTAWELVESS